MQMTSRTSSPSPFARHDATRARHRSLSVLLVDEDFDTRWGLAAYLRKGGIEVETADNGGQALEMTAAFVPDVIVLDDALPAPSGQDVIGILRARRETAALPSILFVAGLADGMAGERADVCLTKPCAPSELLAVVRLLGGRA